MADLEDRLAALGDGPAAPLPGPAAARARGAQRTRRARAALAGAGAVVAVAAVVAGAALTGSGPDRVVQQAAPPSPSTSAAPTPSPASSPVAPQPRALVPAMLLDGPAVAGAVGGDWETAADVSDSPFSLLHLCAEGPQPARAGLHRTVLGEDDALVHSQVLAYADPGTAEAAVRAVRADALRCPERPADSDDGRAVVSSALLSGATTDRVLVEQVSRDCAGCQGHPRSYEVRAVDEVVVVVAADDAGLLEPLVDAAVRRVQDPGAAPATPDRSPTVLPAAFLTPQEAAAAESPGWSVVEGVEPPAEPLLDPCGDGVEPAADRVREAGERALRSQREAGGSSLEQEVHVYDDAAVAREAFDEHADRVAQCPTGPVAQGPADHSIERTVLPFADDRFLVRERYCGPGCTDLYTTYVLVARSGPLVTTARYLVGEDGDPVADAEPLLDAVAARLARAAP